MQTISRRGFLRGAGIATAGVFGSSLLRQIARTIGQEATPPRPKTNFVFILIDDMGYMDIGCNGSTFYETPNIDKLAASGMRFTSGYAACCVCSPTRASILTGKYPARLNLTDWIPGYNNPNTKLRRPEFNNQLPLSESTIADALRKAGYITASIGKWHLGGPEFYPEKHGFNINIGGTDKGQPPTYFDPYKISNLPNRNKGEYLTDRLTDEATAFIETNKDRPFFLYLPHFAVHNPKMAKPEMVAKYKEKLARDKSQKDAVYAAMVESVDQSVGVICKKLDELKLADRTVVIFMSDNGGLAWNTSNAPLRAGKGSMYEGGVREPMIIRWPGVTKPGATCDTPVISTDFFPTIMEMAGLKLSEGLAPDGVSLTPLLRQNGPISREAIYWHYPHYHPGGATPYSAVRQGDFKLIEFFEDNHCELYNLKDDLSEQNDLAAKMPDKVKELRKLLADWRKSVDAKLATPNPNYDPNKKAGKKPNAAKLAATLQAEP